MLKKAIIFFPLILVGCVMANDAPKTVSSVNLKKYMGKWYEIASYPNFFQRGCQCTSAYYKFVDNRVSILNRCYKGKDFQVSNAKGRAWPVANSGNSKLKVQFFWPFRGDYWILYLSPGYQQAIVGSPNREYLWILARHPRVSKDRYGKLIQVIRNKGFDADKLVATNQNCSIQK